MVTRGLIAWGARRLTAADRTPPSIARPVHAVGVPLLLITVLLILGQRRGRGGLLLPSLETCLGSGLGLDVSLCLNPHLRRSALRLGPGALRLGSSAPRLRPGA